MKKRLTGLILFAALLLLNAPISAAVQPAVIYDAETNPVRAQVWNTQGELVWVDVVNAQGGIDYLQTPAGWKRVYTMPTSQEVARQARDREERMEARYNLRIEGAGDNPITAYRRIQELETAVARIPEPLYAAAQAKLEDLGKTLTVRLAGVLPATGAIFGSYSPSTTTMNLDLASTHTHEYGHLVQLTLLNRLYGADRLRSEWTAFNGGAAYGGGYVEGTFITNYASTSFEEDFAESFTYLFDSPTSVQDLAQKDPNCPAIQKLRYLRQVLMECFSVDDSIFYAIDPSQPSAWAQNGVARYLELFPNDTFLASASQPFYPGYQSGTARWDFAQAAYLLADKLERERTGDPDWWAAAYPEYPEGGLRGLHPFTDLWPRQGMLYVRHWSDEPDPVIKLYLMGVVSGTGSESFGSENLITRQEAAVMLHRLCTALGYSFPESEEVSFADESLCAAWALDSIRAVTAAGIMSGVGDGHFDPTGVYTYEQSALTVVRVYELIREG